MSSKQSERRRFLKKSGALAGLAVGAMGSASGLALGQEAAKEAAKEVPVHPSQKGGYASLYGQRSRFATTAREHDYAGSDRFPAKMVTPLQDLHGIITPSPLHFIADHSVPPDIDPKAYRLLIHGMVDRPLNLTLDDLKRLPAESRICFVECIGNSAPGKHDGPAMREGKEAPKSVQEIHGRTSCSEWTGVPLSVVLNEAGVQKGASWIVSEGADSGKFSNSLPLTKALDDVLLAYSQNGEAVRPEQGYPVKLLVPGWHGPFSVKWLRQIKVVDQPYMTMMEVTTHAYSKPILDGKERWFHFEMQPKSVILRPALGDHLPGRGFYEITGLAWSGTGAIRRVEVSTDGGRSWKDAKLQEPVLRMAHTRFRLGWTWDGEETVLQSRCTDEHGEVQPTLEAFGRSWGIPNAKEYWQHHSSAFHFNGIQPWRIDRDGKVHDAIFL
jgi:sulfane dehydrogenase subunit SoxC